MPSEDAGGHMLGALLGIKVHSAPCGALWGRLGNALGRS